LGALGVTTGSAWQGNQFQQSIDDLLRKVRGASDDASAEWKPYEFVGEDRG
jgi:hypothetical protein